MIMNKILVILCVCVLGISALFISEANAQNQSQAVKKLHDNPFDATKIPDDEFVFFGQTLNPQPDFYKSDQYTGARWGTVKYMLPEVFPNFDKGELSAEELCDFTRKLTEKYITIWEQVSTKIGYALKPIFPDEVHEWRLLDQSGTRLHSGDFKDTLQLVEWLPDWENEIMAAKDWTVKTQLAQMLSDAAYDNCEDYAKSQRYRRYSSYWTDKN